MEIAGLAVQWWPACDAAYADESYLWYWRRLRIPRLRAWNTVANVNAVDAFGFGAAAPGQSYPAIYIAGWVNNVYGIWQSINDAQSWTQIGTYPDNSLDEIKTISGNPTFA